MFSLHVLIRSTPNTSFLDVGSSKNIKNPNLENLFSFYISRIYFEIYFVRLPNISCAKQIKILKIVKT